MKKNLGQKLAAVGSTLTALQLSAGTVFAQEVSDIDPGLGFASDLGAVINGALSFVMVIAALMVLLYLILGGIEWITSGGDKGKTEEARARITAALVGLAVVAAAWAVMLLVQYFFGLSIFDGNTSIQQGFGE